jgi:hypothetical protein
LPCLHQRFILVKRTDSGMPHRLARTLRAALVSAPGRPCIDAIPIPATTNESKACVLVSSPLPHAEIARLLPAAGDIEGT